MVEMKGTDWLPPQSVTGGKIPGNRRFSIKSMNFVWFSLDFPGIGIGVMMSSMVLFMVFDGVYQLKSLLFVYSSYQYFYINHVFKVSNIWSLRYYINYYYILPVAFEN